jgi:hypothetical protein
VRRHAKAPSAGTSTSRSLRLLLTVAATSALALALIAAAPVAAAPPTVTIDPASEVGVTSAKGAGEVDPEGKETVYYFQHATEAQFANGEWEGFDGFGVLGEGDPATPVSAPITGLAPATVYHLRLVASNEDDEVEAIAAGTFETDPAKDPVLTIEPPANPRYTTAELAGTIDPQGGNKNPLDPEAMPINWALQFSPENESGEFVEWQSVPEAEGVIEGAQAEASGPLAVSGDLPTGTLKPGTTYAVRLFAYYLGYAREATSPGPNPEFETEAVAKPTVDFLATGITGVTDAAAHFAGSVNPNAPTGPLDAATEAAYETTYGFSCAPQCPGLEGPRTLAADDQTHSVEDETAGLEPHKTYAVTLYAENAGGRLEVALPFTTEAVPLELQDLPAGEIDDTSARLFAQLNPHNAPTTYRFQYGTTTAYGSESELAGPIGGNSLATVSQVIKGLAPNTTYHYRLIADNGLEAPVVGADRTFTTDPARQRCPNEEIRVQQEATRLPECMAYELVSPLDTNGIDVPSGVAGSDGDHAFLWSVQLPISDEQGSGNVVDYAAHRTPSGWVSKPLAASGSNNRFALEARSADGGGAIVSVCKHIMIGCLSGRYGVERVNADGSRVQLLDIPHTYPDEDPRVVGAADDLSRVFIRNPPGAPPFSPTDTYAPGTGLYELHDGEVEYAARDEEGEVLPCGALLPGGIRAHGFQQSGVSADGRTIVFESPDPEGSPCPGPTELYVRHDGNSVNISHPRNGEPDEGARFAGASRNGELTYFTTTSHLLAEDTDSELDIYLYRRSSDELERITPGLGIFPERAAVSPAGDYVYFVSTKALDGEGVAGEWNLYAYHAGATRFIATGPFGSMAFGGSVYGDANASHHITPDGGHFLFVSSDPLTSGQATGGIPQIFQDSYAEDAMTCISCPPDGSVPTDQAHLSALGPGGNSDARHQSDDGDTIAFETATPLLPRDTNGVRDVYLWRRGKPLALISSGRSEEESVFQGMSADGKSVFFLATDRLFPAVRQSNQKLYVARAGGGFAELPGPTPCLGELCRGPAGPPPPAGAPGSTGFAGPANPRPCHAEKKHRTQKKRRAEKKRCTQQQRRHAKAHKRAARNDRRNAR